MTITADATITSKGQVTIPKEIRDRLDLAEGTELEFSVQNDGSLRVRPKQPAMERLRAVREQLSHREIDLDAMRRESKRAWSSHLDGEDRA